eukprot:TRINITY_DN5606_c0_g1_i8.p1 TRINITY_DN5606_c0_g1~~TRINITY_DN5606_c0_g1_i8.p1  ORF type:complete len:359 (-),score=85.66 TRINITY_DN5606_c0_g1_i8:35-1111(-)
MEVKLMISACVLATGLSYFSLIRLRLIPKTIKRLQQGFPLRARSTNLEGRKVRREKEITELTRLLANNHFDHKYYILSGRKGIGKTTLMESVMAELRGKQGIIYVKAEQTPQLSIFNRSLARAVNMNLLHKKLTDGSILTNIWNPDKVATSLSELDDLLLILNHIEEAADKFSSQKEYHKPTLIIDHITYLADNNPTALLALQAKAKYWADHNMLTVIFVGTDGRAPNLLEDSSDKVRMNYIELEGMALLEAVEFVYAEIEKQKKSFFPSDEEFHRLVGENVLRHYNTVFPREKATELTKEIWSGTGFLELMTLVEELRKGRTVLQIKELFLRRVYSLLLEAGPVSYTHLTLPTIYSV